MREASAPGPFPQPSVSFRRPRRALRTRAARFFHAGSAVFGLVLVAAFARAAAAPARPPDDAPPIRYRLDLRNTAAHLVQVTMDVPQSPAGAEVQFPAWNNLYQIRDFVRDVQDLSASCDGRPDLLLRIDLETWSSPPACRDLDLQYQVYANQPGPFSAELNAHHAFLNFALLLFYLPRDRARPVRVQFELPQGWKLATLLDAGSAPGEYAAGDYDRLADSPAEAGDFAEYGYTEGGALYRVIVDADPSDYSSSKLVKTLRKITSSETALMGGAPFARYTFIFHFPRSRGGGGGMEHAGGTAITLPADEVRPGLSAVQSIAAHEFFHLWNVKRIRPQALEPIDYVHGNDTRDLWFSEGVTSTYGELTLLRTGLITRRDFYDHLASAIQQLESRPARFHQSAAEAGREAWLEKYPDYFRPERSISYYNKGELLGYLLDLGIRHSSAGRASLDDLMRRLDQDFARRGRYFTESDLIARVQELAPAFPAAGFFRDDVDGTRPLDFASALAVAGLELLTEPYPAPDLGFTALKSFDGPVQVESVQPASAAARAGVEPGDVLVKMNGFYLTALPGRELQGMKPGDQVVFTAERNGRSFDVIFPLGSKPSTRYQVEEMKHATPAQRALRQGWLEGKTRTSEN